MSRSGYTDDCEGWDLIRWRGAVASAIRGKRGQAFLKEMAATLDAMPDKRLIREELEQEGDVCALGAVGKARGINMSDIDPYEREVVAETFGIPGALAAEIMYENDDREIIYEDTGWRRETEEERFARVRRWVQKHIKADDSNAKAKDSVRA